MKRALAVGALLLLAGCSGNLRKEGGYYQNDGPLEPPPGFDPDHTPDAVPQPLPRSASGNARSYQALGKTYQVLARADGYRERGHASWYGKQFQGQKTASGERYDMFQMTAAHKTLPLPTFVRVTNLSNRRSVVVKVNDRGPFHPGRIIDLSYAAAARLGMLADGSTLVEVETVRPGERSEVATMPPAAPGPRTGPSPPPDPGVRDSYLEAGAFDDPISAVALRDQLGGLGFTRVEIRVDDEHQRVLVGPFPDEAALVQAERLLASHQLAARRVAD